MPAPQYSYTEYEAPAPYKFESELDDPLVQVLLEKLEGKLSPEEEYKLKEDITNLQRGIATRSSRIGALPTGTTRELMRKTAMELPIQTRLLEQQKQSGAISEVMGMLGFESSQQQYGYGQAQQAGQFGFGQAQQAEQFGFDRAWQDYWNKKHRQWQLEDIARAEASQSSPWMDVLGAVGTGVGYALGGPLGGLAAGALTSGTKSLFTKKSSGGGYPTGKLALQSPYQAVSDSLKGPASYIPQTPR